MSTGAAGITFVRRRRLPRPGRRALLALAALLVILGGAWLWVRDSSLVSVRQVRIEGNNGPEAAQIRAALIRAAKGMTTLDVRQDELQTAVAPYPVVKGLQVDTQFPHGLRIRVVEQIPVAAVLAGGRTVAVAADGTLLHDVPTASLPQIPARVAPGGTHVSDPATRAAVTVLGAAPYAILSRVSQVTGSGGDISVQLRSGPTLLFGDAASAAAKWQAALAVLADSGSAGAQYIDVSDPARPAAGVHSATATSLTTTTSTTG